MDDSVQLAGWLTRVAGHEEALVLPDGVRVIDAVSVVGQDWRQVLDAPP